MSHNQPWLNHYSSWKSWNYEVLYHFSYSFSSLLFYDSTIPMTGTSQVPSAKPTARQGSDLSSRLMNLEQLGSTWPLDPHGTSLVSIPGSQVITCIMNKHKLSTCNIKQPGMGQVWGYIGTSFVDPYQLIWICHQYTGHLLDHCWDTTSIQLWFLGANIDGPSFTVFHFGGSLAT